MSSVESVAVRRGWSYWSRYDLLPFHEGGTVAAAMILTSTSRTDTPPGMIAVERGVKWAERRSWVGGLVDEERSSQC